MAYPTDRRYSNEHEWAKQDGDEVVIGITNYAQESLGDVVYLELPKEGDELTRGEPFGVVESTKAVSELFAPLSGSVVAVNSPLIDSPETINVDPHEGAWMIRVKPSDTSELESLLSAEQYEKFITENA